MPAASPNIPFPPDPPLIIWKPAFGKEKPLENAGEPTFHTTLKEAFDVVNNPKGKICLVTRMRNGWGVFEYKDKAICKVTFDKIRVPGLPLGGDPLNPKTYIFDSRGSVATIDHVEDRYRLREIARPSTDEPSGPWVPALVPFEEHNDGRNLVWVPRFAFRPTPDELQTTIAWIDQHMPEGTKVKAGGSQHAWSKIAVTNDTYILPHGLKLHRPITEEPKVYRNDLGERLQNLVRLGSGVKVREANRYLWEHGKAFPALPGYDAQTMGGIFNTGTHGSCFTFGPLAEMIMSIELVLSNGRLTRIERNGGITDPAALATQRPDITLHQDDDYFYAALINMGTMGVVHSYVFEVTDRFHMREVRTATNIATMKSMLKDGKIYNLVGVPGKPAELAKVNAKISDGNDGGFKDHPLPAYHFELLFGANGDKVVVTSRHPITVDDDTKFRFEPPGRDLLRTLFLGAKFGRPPLPTWFQERWRKLVVPTVDTITKLFPSAIPWLNDQAMNTLIDKEYVDRSFNVFNVGEGTNRIPACMGTIYVPLENDMYLDAVDVIQAVAKQFAARRKYETGPVSMRFIKSTKALLGCPKDYCGFECIFTASTLHIQEMIDAYDLALYQKFGHEVRAHWGQLIRDPDEERLRASYPKYDRWRAIRDEFDPKGRFLNEWQTKVLPPRRP